MNESFWSVFSETGDPVCYLLYKASSAGDRKQKEQHAEIKPQPPECAASASV